MKVDSALLAMNYCLYNFGKGLVNLVSFMNFLSLMTFLFPSKRKDFNLEEITVEDPLSNSPLHLHQHSDVHLKIARKCLEPPMASSE